MMKIIQLLLISIFLTACSSTKDKEPLPAELLQTWLHSYEEQLSSGGDKIFRPSHFHSFPSSRFRMKYTFNLDNTCSYWVLSPNDAHYSKPCHFTYQTNTIQIFDMNNNPIKTLNVLTLLRNRLVLAAK